MLRKCLLTCIFCLCLLTPSFAVPADNGGHAGTPAGFYDDINPDDLDKEDAEDDSKPYQSFSEDDMGDEIIIPPTSNTRYITVLLSAIAPQMFCFYCLNYMKCFLFCISLLFYIHITIS